MKTFAKIPNEIGVKFAPNDVFTLTVMYLTAKYDNQSKCQVTDVTFKQLAELTGLSFGYIKDEFLPRLKDSKFCKIEPFTNDYKEKRNRYFLPDCESNFRIINKRVIHDFNLTPKEKGFLISLFTICENNSFNCGLDRREILDLLTKISRTSFDRYSKKLIEKGYLLANDDEDLLDGFNYSSCLEINCDWIGSISDNTEFLKTENYTKASEYLRNYCFLLHIAS